MNYETESGEDKEEPIEYVCPACSGNLCYDSLQDAYLCASCGQYVLSGDNGFQLAEVRGTIRGVQHEKR